MGLVPIFRCRQKARHSRAGGSLEIYAKPLDTRFREHDEYGGQNQSGKLVLPRKINGIAAKVSVAVPFL